MRLRILRFSPVGLLLPAGLLLPLVLGQTRGEGGRDHGAFSSSKHSE